MWIFYSIHFHTNVALISSKIMNSDITMMNAPTEVIVNTFVRSIDKIDDYKMEWVVKTSHQVSAVIAQFYFWARCSNCKR